MSDERPRPTIAESLGSFTWHDYTISYECHGEGDDVVVLMHGLLLDAALNRNIARALADEGYRVVLLDLLGHGRSDKPRYSSAYRMDLWAEQVIALLDALDVADAVIGGISLGANVSLIAAALAPERIRGLIIEMPVLERAVPFAAFTFVPLMLALNNVGALASVVSRFASKLPRTGIDAIDSFIHIGSAPRGVQSAVLHGMLMGPIVPTREKRSAIDVPTIILGHRNDIIHPFSDAKSLARLMPNATLQESSPVEMRVRQRRPKEALGDFLDAAFDRSESGVASSA